MPRGPLSRDALCDLMQLEAVTRGLPPVFFVRLIWQESHFDHKAVSHVGASGIAQFMPGTARERGLRDPFEPRTALAASAELLSDLAARFGNIGLAAAAYNAGPGRVGRWLSGRSGLPAETRHYVRYITGLSAEAWRERTGGLPEALLTKVGPLADWCRALPVRRLRDRYVQTAAASASQLVPPTARPHAVRLARAQTAVRENANDAVLGDPVTSGGKPATHDGTDEAARDRWGVQIAAYFSIAKAREGAAAVVAQHGTLLGERLPSVVRARAPARGRSAVFSVRVVTETRTAANKLCADLKSAGSECLVMRN